MIEDPDGNWVEPLETGWSGRRAPDRRAQLRGPRAPGHEEVLSAGLIGTLRRTTET